MFLSAVIPCILYAVVSTAVQAKSISSTGAGAMQQQSWVPIDITFRDSPVVTLCKLDFMQYNRAPHLVSKFRDLVRLSKCGENGNEKVEKLSVLVEEMKQRESQSGAGGSGEYHLQPTGFVFHEGRVGSTLVANMLASDPLSMVFSESAPPAKVIKHKTASKEDKWQMFRDVISLMGLTRSHKNLFFKFQSVQSIHMSVVLEAFPETPWVFIYRQPVQTLMSQVGYGKGDGAPCLRSYREPPQTLLKALAQFKKSGEDSSTNQAKCAAHLNMLCDGAISAMNKYGWLDGKPHGVAVDYSALPGAVPRLMLPIFGIDDVDETWINRMKETSRFYSKGGRKKSNEVFTGDSKEKEDDANKNVKSAANGLMSASYEKLSALAIEVVPLLLKMEKTSASLDLTSIWAAIAEL